MPAYIPRYESHLHHRLLEHAFPRQIPVAFLPVCGRRSARRWGGKRRLGIHSRKSETVYQPEYGPECGPKYQPAKYQPKGRQPFGGAARSRFPGNKSSGKERRGERSLPGRVRAESCLGSENDLEESVASACSI